MDKHQLINWKLPEEAVMNMEFETKKNFFLVCFLLGLKKKFFFFF